MFLARIKKIADFVSSYRDFVQNDVSVGADECCDLLLFSDYRSRTLAIADQRTHTGVGEDFQQDRVRHAPVNDQRAANAALNRF